MSTCVKKGKFDNNKSWPSNFVGTDLKDVKKALSDITRKLFERLPFAIILEILSFTRSFDFATHSGFIFWGQQREQDQERRDDINDIPFVIKKCFGYFHLDRFRKLFCFCRSITIVCSNGQTLDLSKVLIPRDVREIWTDCPVLFFESFKHCSPQTFRTHFRRFHSFKVKFQKRVVHWEIGPPGGFESLEEYGITCVGDRFENSIKFSGYIPNVRKMSLCLLGVFTNSIEIFSNLPVSIEHLHIVVDERIETDLRYLCRLKRFKFEQSGYFSRELFAGLPKCLEQIRFEGYLNEEDQGIGVFLDGIRSLKSLKILNISSRFTTKHNLNACHLNEFQQLESLSVSGVHFENERSKMIPISSLKSLSFGGPNFPNVEKCGNLERIIYVHESHRELHSFILWVGEISSLKFLCVNFNVTWHLWNQVDSYLSRTTLLCLKQFPRIVECVLVGNVRLSKESSEAGLKKLTIAKNRWMGETLPSFECVPLSLRYFRLESISEKVNKRKIMELVKKMTFLEEFVFSPITDL